MQPRSWIARMFVYLLLLAGSAVFLFPLAWLLLTSVKPVEQTMSMPPIWIPRAHYATLDGRRMEVTRDYRVDEPSVLVQLPNGRRELLPVSAFDPEKHQHLRDVPPGAWHITERSPTASITHTLVWDVVPDSAIESHVAPRWSNYRVALQTMGGRGIDEYEGTVVTPKTRLGVDANVSFGTFLWNTLFVCVLGSLGAVLSNALVAYSFAKLRWRGRDLLFAMTLATMMVPFPVLMVPLYGVFRDLGWVGTLKPLWVPAFFGSAFNIFLMRQFFRTIPVELSEAARIDGCSEWGIFWRIILPLSKPALMVVALFHFLGAWNDFMGPLLYLTRKHTFTLALALQTYQSQHGGVQWHLLMAASAVVILPIIILFFFTQKSFIKGIATTGIKG